MANIRPPSHGGVPGAPRPERRLAPTPQERPADPGAAAELAGWNPAARPPAGPPRPAAATAASRTSDVYRSAEAAPVQRAQQVDPALRPPGSGAVERTARRSEVLSRATGGATEAYDPGAPRVEGPIEPSTAIKDAGGRLLTPHLDAWMRVLDARGTDPPSPRGCASELCALADADALSYAAVLQRIAGAPAGALLRGLGPLELTSFFRLLGQDAREGLVGAWAVGFRKRLAHRDEPALAAEVNAVLHARPRTFGTLLDKAGAEPLRAVLLHLPPGPRAELLALIPAKLLERARPHLGNVIPAPARPAAAAQPASSPEAPAAAAASQQTGSFTLPALVRLGAALDALRVPEPGSAEAVALRSELGRELLAGGAQAWKALARTLEGMRERGFRGAEGAALILSWSLEGLRQAALQSPPAASAGVLTLPFSLSGRFEGLPKAVLSAVGKHCSDELLTVAGSPGLWRALVADVLRAVRSELGDSEAARAWQREVGC